MSLPKKRVCPECKTEFTPNLPKHFYCRRRCYKRGARRRARKELHEGFPIFRCERCRVVTKLDFAPVIHWQKWQEFTCICGWRPMGQEGKRELPPNE